MAHPKRKISKTRKDKRTNKALSENVTKGAIGLHKASAIQGAKIIGGILSGSIMPIAIKKTQITVGGVTALIGTTDYIEKISNLPAFQNNENVRFSRKQGRSKYLPKIKFSGKQYQEAMHLVSVSLNTDSNKK